MYIYLFILIINKTISAYWDSQLAWVSYKNRLVHEFLRHWLYVHVLYYFFTKIEEKPKLCINFSLCLQGTLEDGTEFDSSIPRGNPLTFTLGSGQVIKGWDQGLIGMCEGEQRKLVIPPELAYGAAGAPPKIPKSATLTFHVDLVKIERKDEL